MYCVRGEQLEQLTNVLRLPFEVEVSPNGTFRVENSKARRLEDGQTIRRDGWLINSNGLIQPVFDFVWMQGGRVIIVRGGVAEPLREAMTFSNNLHLAPDASCVYPGSTRSRLADGQLFRMDGTPVPSKDGATMKNGVVVVQKDATLFSLPPFQVMGMSDASAVYGNGVIKSRDGTTIRLQEGQTVLIEGAAARH